MVREHKIRVLVCNRFALLRDGIHAVLERDPMFEVVGEATQIPQVLRQFKRLHPDVVLVDAWVHGKSGAEVTRRLKESDPQVKVIVVSSLEGEREKSECLQAGATYYLRISAGSEALKSAIHNACHGATFAA